MPRRPRSWRPRARVISSENGFGDEHNLDDFASVEAVSYYEDVDMPDGFLAADNVQTRRGDFSGVEVVGSVTNMGSLEVENADVVALFFDDLGNELGFARGYIENIPAGGDRAFQISSDFADIKLAQIAETKVYASAWDF
jgi:hypothetical protein